MVKRGKRGIVRALSMMITTAMFLGMALSPVQVVFAEEPSNEEAIVISKRVSKTKEVGEYLLTLDAYVKGTSRDEIVPADIVIVLDQSASMYTPMGAEKWESNETLLSSSGVTVLDASEVQPGKAVQRGYYIAQNQEAEDGVYDWFIIHYNGSAWDLYRVPNTSTPSVDSDSWHGSVNTPDVTTVEELPTTYNYYKTQYSALFESLTAFTESIIESPADHRIALVGFSDKDNFGNNRDGSGVYVNGVYNIYDSNLNKGEITESISESIYASALMSSNSSAESIRSSVKAITTEYYGTRQDVGFEMAENILDASTETEREQVVVMFTDGKPSPSGSETQQDVESWAVDKANEIKALGSDVKIYSIATSTVEQVQTDYLDKASSNYANGAKVDDEYYMYVTSSNDLLDSFEKILNDIGGAYIELGEKSMLIDTVSTGFDLKENTTVEDIKVYTAAYLGNGVFDEKVAYPEANVEFEVVEGTDQIRVIVTGFDYSKNYVSEDGRGFYQDFRGKKIIVEVPIAVSEDNMGGNYLATNDTDSAIYNEDGTLVKAFPVPHVDVPTTVYVNKIVTGNGADATKAFDFNVTYDELTDLGNYMEDEDEENLPNGSSNKVEALLNKEKTTKTFKVSDKKLVGEKLEEVLAEIDNVYFGSALQISEIDIPEGYKLVSVKVDGKEYNADANGVYTIPVTAGMVIDVTNEKLPAAPVTVPDTGDHANITGYTVALLASVMVAGVAFAARRRS